MNWIKPRRFLAGLIEVVTFHRIRFLWPMYGAPRLDQVWTPWTYGLKTGGWVYLSPRWLLKTWRYERDRRRRVALARRTAP